MLFHAPWALYDSYKARKVLIVRRVKQTGHFNALVYLDGDGEAYKYPDFDTTTRVRVLSGITTGTLVLVEGIMKTS